MTRTSPLPVIALVLVAAALVVVGCTSRTSSQAGVGATPAAAGVGEPADAAKKDKLFANWNPAPDGVLIVSGEQIGFLEPCGCTEGQRGGLARRLDLVQKLKAQDWKVGLIDLGSLINDPNTHGGPDETKIRFGFALKGLQTLGYSAFGIGPADLKLGVQELVGQFLNLGDGLKVVCANVRPNPDLGLDAKFPKSLRMDVGGVKLGVTSVLDMAAIKAVQDPDLTTMLMTHDPADTVPDVLADLEKDTDFQVLMVQGDPEAARRMAKSFPGFDIVVATSAVVDPPSDAETVNGGKTRIISVGKKGQYVGVLGLNRSGDERVRYRRIELGARYSNKTEPIHSMIDVEFQDELRRAGVLESYVRRAYVFNDAPADASYVGAETCKSCHPNTYNKWANSKHATAYEALIKGPRGNHEADADCVRCHTTGFEYRGGFVTAEQTPLLKGNQCENCHGPGSKHAAEPDEAAFRRAMARNSTDFDKNGRCIVCHSEDDSPKFNFATYYGKIVHKGLDTYTDPRVHKGVEPKVARKAP